MSIGWPTAPRLGCLAVSGVLALSAAVASTAAQSRPLAMGGDQSRQTAPAQDWQGFLNSGDRDPRRYGYHGSAGLYSCAPGRVDTYLARKACGGAKFPNRFF